MKLALVLLLFWSLCANAASNPLKPNILLILVDDMGYSDVGCFGGEIQTPNLDRLAKNGLRFTDAYNYSRCDPSRASLMTGVYWQRTNGGFAHTATAGEVLRPAGYRTLWVGKHHSNMDPRTRGFDDFEGFLGGAVNFWNPGEAARPGENPPPHKAREAYKWIIDGKEHKPYTPPKGFYTTDAFTNQAIEWLEQDAQSEKPFFLYVAYNAPHWPLHAWPEDIAKYDGVYDSGYSAVQQARYKRQLAMGLFDAATAALPDQELAKSWDALSPDDRKKWADRMEIHAAMVDRVDQSIGRILAVLEKQGRLENTLIAFLSDNGASSEYVSRKQLAGDYSGAWGGVNSYECIGASWSHTINTPMRMHKMTSYQGGMNTPLIIHWPKGISDKGAIRRDTVHLVDFLPTWMELAGATYPGESKQPGIPPVDGISLLPAFRGVPLTRPGPLFHEWGSGRAIIDGTWKLLQMRDAPWELYDLGSDRTETTDLARKQPERAAELRGKWEAWRKTLP